MCIGCNAQGAEHFSAKISIEVTQTSGGAITAVENNGGTVRSIYYGQTFLRYLLDKERWEQKGRIAPKNPRPPLKRIGYWLDWSNRGYLSTEAQLADAGIQPASAQAHEDTAATVAADADGERV